VEIREVEGALHEAQQTLYGIEGALHDLVSELRLIRQGLDDERRLWRQQQELAVKRFGEQQHAGRRLHGARTPEDGQK